MNALLVLSFEKANRIADFRGEPGQRAAANLGHALVAFLDHELRGVRVERAVRREGLGQCLAAVIDAAHKNQFFFIADQDRALQVAHIEEKKRVLRENFRVCKFESIERTNGRELENVR